MLDRFLDWLAGLPAPLTYLVLAALSALENVFPPVPADVAVAVGAFLARRGEVGVVTLGVVCWLANCASAAGVYFVARRRGPEFLSGRVGRRLVPPLAVSAVREAYERHGSLGIFVSRFLPGVRAAVLPFAGVVGLSPLRALVPAATASAIWYAGLVALGATAGLSFAAVRAVVERTNAVLGFVALGAALAVAAWLWRRLRRPTPGAPRVPPDA